MTDRDALLQAILAEPADDGVRLVYADCLEEAGEGERAEFIRVQCELAELGDDGGPVAHNIDGKCACFLCALRRRERELLTRANFDAWSVDLPVTIAQNFRRGFVHAVTCTAADWLAHADAILAAQPVEEVALTTWPGRAASVGSLPGRFWLIPPEWTTDCEGEICAPHEQDRRVQYYLSQRWSRVRFTLPPAIPETIFGVPIIVDPNLPPGDWQFGAPPNFGL